jgi:hypothetical protein
VEDHSPQRPSAAGPQPKFGISRAKAPRPQRSDDDGVTFLIDYSSFPSELGLLCALARVNPRVRVQVSGKFARTAQSFNNSRLRREKRLRISPNLACFAPLREPSFFRFRAPSFDASIFKYFLTHIALKRKSFSAIVTYASRRDFRFQRDHR